MTQSYENLITKLLYWILYVITLAIICSIASAGNELSFALGVGAGFLIGFLIRGSL